MLPYKPFTFSNRLKRKMKNELLSLESIFSKSDISHVAKKMREALLQDFEDKI